MKLSKFTLNTTKAGSYIMNGVELDGPYSSVQAKRSWLTKDADLAKSEVFYYPNKGVALERWWRGSVLHRDGEPALQAYYEDDTLFRLCWYQYGELHNDDGPAWVWYRPDGSVEVEGWYQHDECHRDDGPAVVRYWPDGSVEAEGWYQHGVEQDVREYAPPAPEVTPRQLVRPARYHYRD